MIDPGQLAGDVKTRASPEMALAHLDSLPTLAPVAVKVLQMASRPETPIADLVSVLQADQTLTGRLLGLVNSAAYGVRQPVTTVDRAVVLLGYRAVRNTVLAVKVFETFSPRNADPKDPRGVDRAQFWKHSLGVACAARRLARAQASLGVDPEEAFVAGLLHDIGKVALDAVFPRAYERIASRAKKTRGDIVDAERAVLGIDHTVAGRYLAQRWSLPRHLQEVVWLHHLPSDGLPAGAVSPAMIAVVQLADTVVREQRLGASGNFAFYESSSDLALRLGISPDVVAGFARELTAEVAELAALLGIEQQTTDDAYFESLAKANAELSRLNGELARELRHHDTAARAFAALARLDANPATQDEGAALTLALVAAAAEFLKLNRVALFAERQSQDLVDLAWQSGGESATRLEPCSPALRAWLHDAGAMGESGRGPLPSAVRELLAPVVAIFGRGKCWMLPIPHGERWIGGIVCCADATEEGAPLEDTATVRDFLASLGQRLALAHALAAARRETVDLATASRSLMRSADARVRTLMPTVVAEIAGGAGHELNNPLSVISGRAQLLQKSVTDPEALRSLKLIQAKAHECSQIVRELMDFAAPRAPQISALPVAPLLRELHAAWIRDLILSPQRLHVAGLDATAQTAVVAADADQLRIVLTELVKNAVEAVGDGPGNVRVTWRTTGKPPWAPASPSWRLHPSGPQEPRDYVEFTVTDNGPGMPRNVLDRAFDPFYSHQKANRRRGLGLPRARRIIDLHGGFIRLESDPGVETIATVALPAAQNEPGTSRGPGALQPPSVP